MTRERVPPGALAALAWARARVGIGEDPPGSRRGPEIDAWQQACGLVGHAWCGAFAAAALRAGGLDPPAAIVWTPHLLAWARAGEHGFALATWEARAPGDLVLFRFGDEREVDHVGLLDLDLRHTIEGNTTADGRGHEAAGGVVARRDRGGERVVALARPAWPPR